MMLSLNAAAEQIGYSPSGLRKLVERSRQRQLGQAVDGPTIQFFQASKNSRVKFRPEWLEAFVEQHTCDPTATPIKLLPGQHRKKSVSSKLDPARWR